MLIIATNVLVLLAIFIRKCVVRKTARSVNIYCVNQQQQETSFTNNAGGNLDEDRFYDFSMGSSSVVMDFHYYDEVPVYSDPDFSSVERTKV